MLSVFCSPSRYTQGKNATALLGQEILGLGLRGPALVLAGRSATRLLTSTWQATFSEAQIDHAVQPFGGESSPAEIERVKSAARRHQAQVVVGAGGGKVLDTARAADFTRTISAREHSPPKGWTACSTPASPKVVCHAGDSSRLAERPATTSAGPRSPRPSISLPSEAVAFLPWV